MKLVRYSFVNVILNVSALVTDSSSSLKHADISFQWFFRNYFWFLSTIYGGFSLMLRHLHCFPCSWVGKWYTQVHVHPKCMKIVGGCCLFNKGIMGDALVIIHNQEKVKGVLRKSSKKQVQNWLPVELPGVKSLIWAILTLNEKNLCSSASPLPWQNIENRFISLLMWWIIWMPCFLNLFRQFGFFVCFSASGINQNFLQANHVFEGKIIV